MSTATATKPKVTDWVDPKEKSGEFKRQTSSFRDFISREPGARYPPERDRYHLYVSYACPWAHRTLIARKLKGLDTIISFSAVHWHLGEKGWRFVTKAETEAGEEENKRGGGCEQQKKEDDDDKKEAEAEDKAMLMPVPGENVIPDPVDGHERFTHLADVYFESEPDYAGRFTVPVLYDKKTRRIVSNESSEILRMLGSEFNDLVKPKFRSLDLYPAPLRSAIDDAHAWHYDLINNGVYKAGFATAPAAYERHVVALFSALDRVEKHLREQQQQQQQNSSTGGGGPPPFYWFGSALTEVDIRLFVTLVRFDPVYVQHFKCNLRDIRSGYPAVHAWMRRLYWATNDDNDDDDDDGIAAAAAAFRDTTRFDHIKWHYTRSHAQINPHAITPLGPVPDILPLDEEVAAVTGA